MGLFDRLFSRDDMEDNTPSWQRGMDYERKRQAERDTERGIESDQPEDFGSFMKRALAEYDTYAQKAKEADYLAGKIQLKEDMPQYIGNRDALRESLLGRGGGIRQTSYKNVDPVTGQATTEVSSPWVEKADNAPNIYAGNTTPTRSAAGSTNPLMERAQMTPDQQKNYDEYRQKYM